MVAGTVYSNEFYGLWREQLPIMRQLVRVVGRESWHELQTDHTPTVGRRWHKFASLSDDDRVLRTLRCMKILRRSLRRRYSYSIPSEEALQAIASIGEPMVEIGAGKGYWAKLLQEKGVDIVATDRSEI